MRSSGFSQQETPPDTTSGIFCQHPANGSARCLPLPIVPRLHNHRLRLPSSSSHTPQACRLPSPSAVSLFPYTPHLHDHHLCPSPSSSHTPQACTATAPSVAFLFPPTHLQTGRSRSTTDYEPSAPVGRDNASIGCRIGRSHSHNKSEAPDLSVRSFET